ncbi:ComGF family competence protein [bacterium]|nr:ComGF family competence protein [bacterium]
MKTLRGFTYIEFIIVIVLIAILGSIAALMLKQNYTGYFTAKKIMALATNATIATDNLMRELKSTSSLTALSATSLTFVNQQGQTIVIDLSGTTLRRNVNAAGAQTMCSQVSSVAFAYFDSAFATTAVAANVRFITLQMTVTNVDGLSYSVMGGTNVLRTLLPLP